MNVKSAIKYRNVAVWMLYLITLMSLNHSLSDEPDRSALDASHAIVVDSTKPETERIKSLTDLLTKHISQGVFVKNACLVFSKCRWFQKADYEIVGSFAGEWPFPKSSPGETTLIAIKFRVDKTMPVGLLYIAIPQATNITLSEIASLLSGKCPQRVESIMILGSKLIM